MVCTLIVNNTTLRVESNDGVSVSKIEFAGTMVEVNESEGIIKLNQAQRMELHAAWLSHIDRCHLDDQAELNESWKA